MIRKSLFFLLAIVILTGCYSTPKKMAAITTGMPRWKVIEIMGEPFSSSTILGRETLEYHLWEDLSTPYARRETYQVILTEGKVTQYGPVKPLRSVMLSPDSPA